MLAPWNESDVTPSNRSIRRIIVYTFLAVLLFPYLAHEIYANDLWKSLYFGRYVAQTGVFPNHGEFAFTPTVSPVPSDVYSWLGHLTIFGVYRLGSVEGLILFRVLLVMGSLLLVHSLVGFRTNLVIFLLLLLWGIGLTQKTLVRTAITVIPAVTLFWWVLDRARGNERWLWLGLPVLFTVWSNLHGSYLYGIGLLGLVAVGLWIDSTRSISPEFRFTWKQCAGVLGVVILLVTFVKPYPDLKLYDTVKYGLSLPVEMAGFIVEAEGPYAVLEGARSLIYQGSQYEGQMRSIAGRALSLGYLYVPYVFVSMFLGISAIGWLIPVRRRRFSLLLPVFATVVMGSMYLRFVALIPLTVVPVLLINSKLDGVDSQRNYPIYRGLAVLFVLFLGVAPWWYVAQGEMADYMRNDQFHVGVSTSGVFSERMPAYIRDHYPEERLFTHYDIGGYLIWRLWPEKKVFIDSKNWAYERSFRNEYLRSSPPEMMKRYNLDLAVIPLTSAWNYYLFVPSPQWRLLKYDQGMALYGKKKQTVEKKRLLLPPAERAKLDHEDRDRLERFQQFVHEHENRESHVGIFTSPET